MKQNHTLQIYPKNLGGCAKCSNQRRGNMNNYETARKVFEEGGEILPKQEYKGNKVKLFYTCSNCQEEAHISLSEFRRGKRIVAMGFKMVLYICNKHEYIEKRIYSIGQTIVEPSHPAEIIIEDDDA